uniref:Cadherin domain-containing protein n=1 Tax=Hippocampus comes TaxID=109280 RepID=A0A3Q2XV01_HIPCM
PFILHRSHLPAITLAIRLAKWSRAAEGREVIWRVTRSLHRLNRDFKLPKVGNVSVNVSATDPDQDADQTALRYSLHGQGAGGEFTINERTGSIYAQRRLDREERPAWRFLVLATDEGGSGLTGFADVLLEVRDINDNAPFFPCPALEVDGCFVGQVPENSPADTSVMEMRAMDLDDPNEGKNAALSYSIVKNVRNEINLNLFSINATTGTIYTVLRSLDREAEERYLVVVEARDGGGLAGTGTATILVSDVNDHPPIFSQRVYTTQVNSEVLVVSATDGDQDENAVVTFSIVGGDDDRKFLVETDKVNRRGVIKLKKKVDFEKPQERTFNLTLKAEDADFFSLAYCLVQVEDANDHAPVFLPQFYESPAMSEDVPVGTIVAQVMATDLDSGQNGRFSYSIAKESDPYDQFLVDQSGWVVVANSLDREKISQHRVMVLATDAGSPGLTGTAIVMVTVLDVNDNGPEFEAPYRPVVWENTAAPQAVWMNASSLLLHATDRDLSSNGGPFSIRLLPLTADAADFNLTDFRNGSASVTALRTFDRERRKEYRLPILMIDSGSPAMSSTSTFRCRCHEGFRGQRCELGQYRGHRLAALSPSSILAISMCLLVFFAVLVAVTVWNQKGSRNKFRKRGVYHIPTEHESWEDVRENILNYNEEGGGEQDQVTNHQEPQTGLQPSIQNLCIPQPHLHTHPPPSSSRSHVDFKSYVSRIVWEADQDEDSFPEDVFHRWREEGSGTPAGSLSSLGNDDEEEENEGERPQERLSRWGPKFQTLSDIYDRPQVALSYGTTARRPPSH